MELSIKDKWGKSRKAIKFNCAFCSKETIQRIWNNRQNKFCSPKCVHESRKERYNKQCLLCNRLFEVIKSNKKAIFCSRVCKEKAYSGENHHNWKGGSYRQKAIDKYGFVCAKGKDCQLKNIELPKFLFEVDHIDLDRDNNNIENLQVLCVWCHRLKHSGV